MTACLCARGEAQGGDGHRIPHGSHDYSTRRAPASLAPLLLRFNHEPASDVGLDTFNGHGANPLTDNTGPDDLA